MRSASPKPRVMARTSFSPLRSSRALVATVVPIFTASNGPPPCSAVNRLIPSTAASSYWPGLSESSFAVSSWPSGARATTSVKVPPRSIEKDQRPVMKRTGRLPRQPILVDGRPAMPPAWLRVAGGQPHLPSANMGLADHAIEHRDRQDEVGARGHHGEAGRRRLLGVVGGDDAERALLVRPDD